MTTELRSAIARFLTVPVRARTYKRLAYLLLAFPLGMLYFVGFTVGASLGAGLLITWVGLPLLLLTIVGATAVSGFEAHLARTLLDRDVPVPAAIEEADDWARADEDESYVDALRRVLTEPTTWTSVGVVIAKFAFGIVAFTATVTAGAVVGALLAAPALYHRSDVAYRIGSYTVDTMPEALAASAVGVVGVFVALNLLNALATVGGLLTDAFLSMGRGRKPPAT